MELAAVIVQAGGTGARLGGASKPDVVVGGRRLLDIFFAELASVGFSGRAVVVAPEGVAVPAGAIRTLEDPPHGGPLAGIAAGLERLCGFSDDAVVGLGTCDAPLAPRLYPQLLARLELVGAGPAGGSVPPCGVVPAADQGWLQYLHGIYRIGALRALPFERDKSIRSAFAGLDVVTNADPLNWCIDVDTPQDLAALEARL
ncbi:molybdenum cofactor guanylyltransferase [Trueperella abortisuis]|uniref:Molybdopterin-guanine dinucleotide biosynthesis protein A n=1 Tax=Trueperella abortisuis TaxID=445930 RepID=A0ABT9PKU9_9ACTO|nr:NTP transferase domain-containing protein [Trueperella abortisuis]MDP9833344.1 molybdopterin-guanine dinucleotide biosynthesis protein A [Trueperella abortisuis]